MIQTMKKFSFLVTLAFLTMMAFSQEYSFPLYFEDAVGNKDTLTFGFDQSATFGVDENLGEVNLLGQPYDSTFFVFFTDAANSDEFDRCFEKEKKASYLLEKQYVNLNSLIEIGIIVQHWPFKVSWNEEAIRNFEKQQYGDNDNIHLVMTSFHPINGYPDALCCGGELKLLRDSSEFIFGDQLYFCKYKSNISNDSIYLLSVVGMDITVNVINLQTPKPLCRYNKDLQSVTIQSVSNNATFEVEIYNLWGTKMVTKQMSISGSHQFNIRMNQLPDGLYLIRVFQLKPNASIFTYKILKL